MIALVFIALRVAHHLSSAALLARGLKIKLREVSFGLGPAFAVRPASMGPIPANGLSTVKDSEAEYPKREDMHDAFDASHWQDESRWGHRTASRFC